MTPRTMRKAERAVHLVWALLLALYVYGLLPSWGVSAVRWIVVPGIAASGFAMWFAATVPEIETSVVVAPWRMYTSCNPSSSPTTSESAVWKKTREPSVVVR